MKPASGFTFIEVILTVALTGLLATMLGPYLLGSVAGSPKPLVWLADEVDTSSWMERIMATAAANPSDLAAVRAYVEANAPGHFAVDVNSYAVLEDRRIVAKPGLATGQLLVVTIRSPQTGQTLTALFADHAS